MDERTGEVTNQSNHLAACYQKLHLYPDATADAVDAAYFRLRAQEIREGDRAEVAALKEARNTIKAHLQALAAADSSTAVTTKTVERHQKQHPPTTSSSGGYHVTDTHAQVEDGLPGVVAAIAQQGLTAKVSKKDHSLNLGISLNTPLSPSQITAKVRHALAASDRQGCDLEAITTVCLYGLDTHNKAQWKKTFPLPAPQITTEDTDLYSFNNRFSNTLIFPGLLLMGALLSCIEAIKLLLFGVHIWIHEFGHATVAWLGGYRATPLPFGWTNIGAQQSMFVYVGVLALLGLLFYTGKKEQSRWSMGLAVGLAVLQFFMTWIISEDTFYMLVSFGGIGGEFYLSALLIVSFYFPLPAYWRWDFFRYPAALFASFVLMSSAWQWRQIDRGLEAIPWGSLFGGSEHIGGDMNQLSIVYGWSDQRIIDTYNSIGAVCAIAILSTYFYIFIKQRNHVFLHQLWLRSQAR